MAEQQLPLSLKLADQAVFDSYFAGPNAEIVAQLMRQPEPQGGVVWLWGQAATGKTHLLQSLCAANDQSAYLPLKADRELPPEALQGFAQFDIVCLDDVDQVLGDSEWERRLFLHFNEAISERGHTLVITSKTAPKNIAFNLNDLRSRLLSGPVYRLESLSDDELLAAVKLRAKRRGLKLPSNTGRFLLSHFQRDMRSLCELLDRLDTASLIHQSRLTIALVKSIL